MSFRRDVDVLVVRTAATFGLRVVEEELVEGLRELGVSVATASTDYGLLGRLRVAQPLIDLVEATCVSVATRRALRDVSPHAIIFSSNIAAILQASASLRRGAIRYDAPASLNRPGARNLVQHLLERRSRGRAKLLLPLGVRPAVEPADHETAGARLVPLPPYLTPATKSTERRGVLLYAANPAKKGLDIAVRAWALANTPDRRLLIAGVDAERGRRFLRGRSVPEPPGLEWCGTVAPERFRQLTASSEVFLSASRFEDFGTAQLEGLLNGALLVTVPSGGPVESLSLAREMAGDLVAEDLTPESLARALEAALALDTAERTAYQTRAARLLEPYSREAFLRRLGDEVLPALLGRKVSGA